MKLFRAALATFTFLALLLGVYCAHVAYFRVDVVLFGAILDAVIAASVSTVLLYRMRFFSLLNGFERLQLAAIWILAGYVLAISVPTVIDRSLSFYILEKIQQRGGGIRLDRFEDVFTREYVKEHHLVDVRITEQLASGTVTIRDGCVLLTERGQNLARFSRYFRQHLLPKKRLLMGEYTDVLTDPFRNSATTTGYECQ